jgi:hypothetical protein
MTTTYGLTIVEGAPLDQDGFWLVGWSRHKHWKTGVPQKAPVFSQGHLDERITWKTQAGAEKNAAELNARTGRLRWSVKAIA